MRRITQLLALSSLFILPIAGGCGGDDDDNPGSTGKGGSTSGKGGSTSKGGSNPGGDTGNSGGDPSTAGETGMGGDTSTAGGTGEGGGAGDGPIDECDVYNLPDGGDLPATGTVTGGMAYDLHGRTEVVDSLTIEPCTLIRGAAQDDMLIVMPNGQLIANGTANEPIVFTSGENVPAPGDWGGVIILGNDVCNDAVADTKCEVEGFATNPPQFGNIPDAAVSDESSGSLQYVRIEYSGVDLGLGSEINGLTLAGVGSGTTISHVQIANTLDDCFEWFGGSVNADHLIAWNCGDDMFDTDSGYSGHVQFAFGRQLDTLTTDPNGFEMDNDKTVFDKAPITAPNFSNVTLCGTPASTTLDPKVGAVLRRGTAGALTNVLITGFETAAWSTRDIEYTSITLTGATQWSNGAEYDSNLGTTPTTWYTDQGNSSTAPEDFGDCFADPPAPFPAAAITGVTPTGHADDTAAYQGAFEDADDNWMTGSWVSWN
jgi:hypothetical protein